MLDLIKILDERKTKKNKNNKDRKERRGNRSFSERVRAKRFCCAFKLGFLQLICKASLIFTLNLELVSSIILKETESYESKHVVEECGCLKIWDLLSFFISFSILILKWQHVWKIYLEIQLAQVNL